MISQRPKRKRPTAESPTEQKVFILLADVLRLQEECQRAYNRKCVARNDEKLQAQGYLQGVAQAMTILKLPMTQ